MAYQAMGQPSDAEPLLQQLLTAQVEDEAKLDLLTRLGIVQVPRSTRAPRPCHCCGVVRPQIAE